MFTYQVRKRNIKFKENNKVSYPSNLSLKFILNPLQPFCVDYDKGLTAIAGVSSSIEFNTNTGHINISSKEKPIPLSIKYNDEYYEFNLNGNEIIISCNINSFEEIENLIETLFFQIPILLNLEFIDSPYISRVEGIIDKNYFGWEVEYRETPIHAISKDMQEKKVLDSWKRYLDLSKKIGEERILAALHYFHVACRLKRAGNFPWEFMGEILLNYCKILEVLFPANKDIGTIDSTRIEMKKLGFINNEIEKYYIPSISLRNEIDVAHVDLATFSNEHLQILQKYTESTETKFRKLFNIIFIKIEEQNYNIPKYSKSNPKQKKINIIDKIAKNFK